MSVLGFRNADNLFALVGKAARTGMTTPAKVSNRDALRDRFEKHADWHDTGAGSQAFIEVEAAADLAATWADEQLDPEGPEAA